MIYIVCVGNLKEKYLTSIKDEVENNKELIEEQEERILSSALEYFSREYSKENTIKL